MLRSRYSSLCLSLLLTGASSTCPVLNGGLRGGNEELPLSFHEKVSSSGFEEASKAAAHYAAYQEALSEIDFDEVAEDLKKLMADSQDFWPADYGHYGPFFIRMAWHCSGTFRQIDGHGGCDGGRQRFDPERSWEDNTQLDKARALLRPIKEKYGLGLSWGDLIVYAGHIAKVHMGAPNGGFCAGRVDDFDGSASFLLGPTPEQEKYAPCPSKNDCQLPLGTGELELIYVNPEGPQGNPDPVKSAKNIRDVFGRMGFNDRETVALIGGGHAFGKVHGPCDTPHAAGESPNVNPFNPWSGLCGSGDMKGKGPNTWTTGFEGPWTVNPTEWGNDYFKGLINHEWEVHTGPGGKHQWRVANGTSPVAPAAFPTDDEPTQPIMMLTSDVAFLYDPEYLKLVHEFANDQKALDDAFGEAWYKILTQDMGPITRCAGNMTPPVLPFQDPLPDPPTNLPDYSVVKRDISDVLSDKVSGPLYVPLFVRLAYRCAATYRFTDHRGGCNGGRIRFSPGKDWEANKGLDQALKALEPVKAKHDDNLTWADLIVLAGNVAIEKAAGLEPGEKGGNKGTKALDFCGGRSDDTKGEAWEKLTFGNENFPSMNETGVYDMMQTFLRQGLTPKEFVVLMAGGHSLGQMHEHLSGFSGPWTTVPTTIDLEYLKNILTLTYDPVNTGGLHDGLFKAQGKEVYALKTDLAIAAYPELRVHAENYVATGEDVFIADFLDVWTKLMNSDRFNGPTGNEC